MENSMRKALFLALPVSLLLLSGCAPKTYVSTSPIMSYDLTGIDITTLKTSKVCLSDENTDVSVRHAAEVANISYVYGVDDHTIYETHLFKAPTVKNRCIIIYGTANDLNTSEDNASVILIDTNTTEGVVPVSDLNVTDTNTTAVNATVVIVETNATQETAVETLPVAEDLNVTDTNASQQ